jgi:dipeptide/tripeptide permease
MKKFLLAGTIFAWLASPAHAADSSSEIALALGTVLASEEFCGLDYDQASIRAFIKKKISPNDMDFPSELVSMTAGVRIENQSMSASAKTAHVITHAPFG